MKDHGTRIVLYNLWEDDQGHLELDFDTDPYVSTILNNFCSAENNSKHSIQHVFTICTVLKLVIFQSEKLVLPMFSRIDMLLMRML